MKVWLLIEGRYSEHVIEAWDDEQKANDRADQLGAEAWDEFVVKRSAAMHEAGREDLVPTPADRDGFIAALKPEVVGFEVQS